MDEVGWLEELEQLDAVAWSPPWSKDDDWTVVCEGAEGLPCDGGCTACAGEGTVEVVNLESDGDDQHVGYVQTTGLLEFASANGSLIVAMRNNLRRLLAMARAGEKLREVIIESGVLDLLDDDSVNEDIEPKIMEAVAGWDRASALLATRSPP